MIYINKFSPTLRSHLAWVPAEVRASGRIEGGKREDLIASWTVWKYSSPSWRSGGPSGADIHVRAPQLKFFLFSGHFLDTRPVYFHHRGFNSHLKRNQSWIQPHDFMGYVFPLSSIQCCSSYSPIPSRLRNTLQATAHLKFALALPQIDHPLRFFKFGKIFYDD